MRPAAVLLAPAALVAALVLSACGAGGLDPVAKAADRATSAGSEHVELSGYVVVGAQTVKLAGSGDFQKSPRLGHASFTVDTPSGRQTIDEIESGTEVYIRSPLFARIAPGGASWASIDVSKVGKSLGIDVGQLSQTSPTDTLAALEKAGSVKKIGSETVDGVATTHYQAVVDLSKVPGGSAVAQATHLSAVPIDAWIDDNGLPRRMTLSDTVTAGAQSAATRMTWDLSRYGEPVHVTVPPANETFDLTGLVKG